MRASVVACVLVVALLVPVTASAQDWVMDWTSSGSSVGVLTGPFSNGWSISGTSPVTLTPSPSGMPINFSAPAYELAFTSEGRTYGGPVSAQSNWQSPVWNAPVPCAGIFATSCTISAQTGGSASGSFAFTDANHFSLDVFVGTGHSNTELVATGRRSSATAAAAEPTVLLLSAAGLAGAAIVRRSRRP